MYEGSVNSILAIRMSPSIYWLLALGAGQASVSQRVPLISRSATTIHSYPGTHPSVTRVEISSVKRATSSLLVYIVTRKLCTLRFEGPTESVSWNSSA